MSRLAITLLLLFASTPGYGQAFDARSERIRLNITDYTRDTIPPVLVIDAPTSTPGFPIYWRDSVIAVRGKAEDDGGRPPDVRINGQNPDFMKDSKFMTKVPLKFGKNVIVCEAADRNKNKTVQSLTVYQDPNVDLDPPRLTILEPLAERGFREIEAGDTLFVRGIVRDSSGIFGLWINNAPQAVSSTGEFSRPFPSRPDTLRIVAVDSLGNMVSKVIPIVQRDTTSRDSVGAPGIYHGLVIAIEDYKDPHLPNLYHPLQDAKEVMNVLVTSYTFERKDIIFLQNPTRRQIMTAFERLRKVLTPKDNLLVFYAGHGFWEDDMQQGFWLPSDADPTDKTDWISNSDIRDYIKGIKARHTFLIVDACFGGAIFQMRDIGPEIPRHLKDLFKYPSRTALTSGTLNAVPDKSEFVTYLVKDLAQNRETYLTATELCTYLSRVVPGNSVVPQTPKYGTIVGTGDQNFGDFVFIHR